jgi:excisionase family DNA binding protein
MTGGCMSLYHISIKADPIHEKMLAKKASKQLEKSLLNFGGSISLSVNNVMVELPVSVVNPLIDVLNDLSKGHSLERTIHEEILSTQQAADLLNVSRPFIVKLIDTNELPAFKVGRHRRIYKNDLLAYKKKSLKERKRILQKLVDEAQDLDLGY